MARYLPNSMVMTYEPSYEPWPPHWHTCTRTSYEPMSDQICEIAESVTGWGTGPNKSDYVDLIAYSEPKRVQDQLATKSGCALVARGILRSLGLPDAELHAPYVMGGAMSCLVRVGRRNGCWHGPDTEPCRGDIVLIGTDPTTKEFSGPGHALTVLNVDRSPAVPWIESVDGGQIDSRNRQIIKRRIRFLRHSTGIWIGARRIYGLLRVSEMKVIPSTWAVPVARKG